MSTQDTINAALELCGSLVVGSSVRRLWHDGRVRGVHPWHVVYSVVSSWWFVYYYAHLDQLFSAVCAVLYVCTVGTWALLMVLFFIRECLFTDER